MRLVLQGCLLLMVTFACKPYGEKETDEQANIAFVSVPVKSQSLYARPKLKFNSAKKTMELSLGLRSLVQEKLTINEVVLSNHAGVNSSPEGDGIEIIDVPNDSDTTLDLTFKHIHDKALFQQTGLPGPLDSAYHISVVYSIEGKKDARSITMACKMSARDFVSYRHEYDRTPIQVYFFQTEDGFAESERQYLTREKITTTPPFVHVTEQEVALCGLNFRTKSFTRNDSLYAEIFVVNHSDLTIRIDSSKIDLIHDGLSIHSGRQLKVDKVTGAKHETNILRKGDRIIFTMRRSLKMNPEKIRLSFTDSFFLASGKPLFATDLQLVKAPEMDGGRSLVSHENGE